MENIYNETIQTLKWQSILPTNFHDFSMKPNTTGVTTLGFGIHLSGAILNFIHTQARILA